MVIFSLLIFFSENKSVCNTESTFPKKNINNKKITITFRKKTSYESNVCKTGSFPIAHKEFSGWFWSCYLILHMRSSSSKWCSTDHRACFLHTCMYILVMFRAPCPRIFVEKKRSVSVAAETCRPVCIPGMSSVGPKWAVFTLVMSKSQLFYLFRAIINS